MKANLGTTDRALRVFLGIGMLIAGWYFETPWGFIGLIPLLTATVRFCPLYLPLGLSTNKAMGDGEGKGGCCK